jgi:hypothetical protein
MPAPTVLNDWRFAPSTLYSGASPAAMRQDLLLGVKEHLLGNGTWTDNEGSASSITSAWEVVSSSDSVTASAAVHWDTSTDLVWAAEGVAHSWIVLRHPDYFGVGNPLFMLLNCNPAGTQNSTLMVGFSRAGYSGGSITARPTAADEHIARPVAGTVSTAGWQGDDNSATSLTMRVHFLMTDDGRKFQFYFTRASVCIAAWILFDLDDDANGEWDEPYIFHVASEDFGAGAEAEVLDYNHFVTDTNRLWVGRDESGGLGDFTAEAMMPHAQSLTSGNSFVGTAQNPFDGSWMPFPIPLRGVSVNGVITVVPDMWWARLAAGTGDPKEDPDTADDDFMQFGVLVCPWNRSTILLG